MGAVCVRDSYSQVGWGGDVGSIQEWTNDWGRGRCRYKKSDVRYELCLVFLQMSFIADHEYGM